MNAVIIVSAKESKRTIILRYMQILPLPSELADLVVLYSHTVHNGLRDYANKCQCSHVSKLRIGTKGKYHGGNLYDIGMFFVQLSFPELSLGAFCHFNTVTTRIR